MTVTVSLEFLTENPDLPFKAEAEDIVHVHDGSNKVTQRVKQPSDTINIGIDKEIKTRRTWFLNVLDMPGTYAQALRLRVSHYGPPIDPEEPYGNMIYHYSWKILTASLKQGDQDNLVNYGQATLMWADAKNVIWSKVHDRLIEDSDLVPVKKLE